jgi:hypothetical protein
MQCVGSLAYVGLPLAVAFAEGPEPGETTIVSGRAVQSVQRAAGDWDFVSDFAPICPGHLARHESVSALLAVAVRALR